MKTESQIKEINDALYLARLQVEQLDITIRESYVVVHHLQEIKSVLDQSLLKVFSDLDAPE